MADLRRTIEILFEGTNRTGTAITGISKDLGSLNFAVASVTSPLASVTAVVAKLDAALVALAGAGIAYSVTQFARFEDKMLKVKGIMGASEAQYIELTNLARELGSTTRFTATEAASGLEFLALAGLTFEQSLEALPATLNLAQAAALDLGRSADIVTNIMAGYEIKAADLVKTTDVLTATFTNSNTNLEELGQAFKYVGPVAKGLGLELEETSAILGILASAGYKAESGGTALRNILLALVAPAGNAGKLMKELGVDTTALGIDIASSAAALASLGVTVKDAEGNLRDFPLIMDDLRAGLQKIQDPADRTAILIEIFGKRGGPQMAALLSKGGEAVTGLEDKIRSLGGVTKRISEEMESGMGGALRSLRSAFESVAISAGDNFAEGLIDPIRSAGDLLRAIRFSIDDGAFDPVFDAFNNFGSTLDGNLRAIAQHLPEAMAGVNFDGLIGSFEEISQTIAGIFGDIDFDDPEDLRDAIQKIIDTLESLVDFSDGLAGVFVNVGREILDLIDGFNNLDDETKKTFGSISGIGAVLNGVTGPIGDLISAVKGMGIAMNVVAGGQVVTLIKSLVGTGGLTAALTAVSAHPLIAAGLAGVTIGTVWRKMVPEVDAAAQSVLGFIDKHTGLLGVNEQQTENEKQWIEIQARWKQIMEDRKAAGVDAQTEFKAAAGDIDSATDSTEALREKMRELGILVEEPKKVSIDTAEAEKGLETISYLVGEAGNQVLRTIKVPVDTSEIEKAKETIEDLPLEKRIKFETDIQIAEIKAQADIVSAALEWEAKVDIAQAEAATKQLEAVAQGVTAAFENTGDVIGSLFGELNDASSTGVRFTIERAISEEQDRRDRALKMQEDLTKAEIKNLDARTERLQSGEAMITVNGDGLQPHLEMVMWEIFEAIQVRATQEGVDQLLLGGA
jgi:TP901 family phage tail tape measure protein